MLSLSGRRSRTPAYLRLKYAFVVVSFQEQTALVLLPEEQFGG